MPKVKEFNTDELLKALKKLYMSCTEMQEEIEEIIKLYDLEMEWCVIFNKETTS